MRAFAVEIPSELRQPPAYWRTVPLRKVITRRTARNRADLELLSVSRDRGVVRRADLATDRVSPSEDFATYWHVRPGDVVFNKMQAWRGALGVSRHEGIVSPA